MQPYNSSPFYQQFPQQQPQLARAQPSGFVYYPAANAPAAAAPAPIQAAYHPNLAVTVPLNQQQQQQQQQQPAFSAQPSQEQQQQQQQQLFDYEMLPNSKQLEAEEEESEKEDATKRLVKPVQSTFQQPQPTAATATTAAPQAQSQPQPTFMYPPTQYMMAQQPQPAMPVQPQQPQPQQPQAPQQPFLQQVPTANMQSQQQCHHCHCRHRHMHLRKGLHFKILIVMQLCIAVIFTCLAPSLLPLLFDALFAFGLVMAIIQNVPGLIVFSVGNMFAVILSTWALLMITLATLSGHLRSDMLIVGLLFLVIALVQWLSFISGIHYTVRIAKKTHTNTNTNTNAFPGQQLQPQQLQPQQVVMTNLPGFQYPPAQQAQQAV